MQFFNSELTEKNPDNTVLWKNNTLVQIVKLESSVPNPLEKDIRIYGNVLKIMKSALEYPSDSKDFDMYQVEVPTQNNKTEIEFSVSEIKTKMVLLKIFELNTGPQEWYVVPLLHTLQCS